jgi:serine/threonine protein kinase
MKFDFAPYGYKYILTQDTPILKHISALAPVQHVSKKQLGTQQAIYTFKQKVGAGAYGTIYKASVKGTDLAIKKIKTKYSSELWDSVKEVLIQILLYTETKDLPGGPYAPQVFELAYDKNKNKHVLYIVQELMDGTLESLIKNRSIDQNNKFLLREIDTIASQLEWLGTHLQFNHRDFKTDNVMYKRTSTGQALRLIDFGMSCMTWNGIHLSAASDNFPASHICYRSSRDITSLLFDILRYERSFISNPLFTFLHTFVKPHQQGKEINIIKKINWEDTYAFLNRENVENPRAAPASFRKTIKSSKPSHRFTKKRCRH